MTNSHVDQISAALRESEAIGFHLDECHAASGGLAIDRMADPMLNPRFYDRVRALTHRLRTSEDVRYLDEHALIESPPFDRQNSAIPLLHFAGEPNVVRVLRDLREPPSFAWLYRLRWPRGRCDLSEAAACVGEDRDPMGGYVVITQPPLIITFECCDPCLNHLDDMAMSGDILTEVNAQIDFDHAAEAALARWHAAPDDQDGAR